jgi:polyisoprenoid-binding protein YceI
MSRYADAMPRLGRLAFILGIICCTAAAANAADLTWTSDPARSKVALVTSYVFLSKLNMMLPIASGTVVTDGDAWTRPLRVELHFESAALTTGNPKRDAELRSDKFFDTARYPEITFVSRQVNKTKPGEFIVVGDLNMHGVTRELDLQGRAFNELREADGKRHVHYEATGSFRRADYGITYAKGLVGDTISLDVTIDALTE